MKASFNTNGATKVIEVTKVGASFRSEGDKWQQFTAGLAIWRRKSLDRSSHWEVYAFTDEEFALKVSGVHHCYCDRVPNARGVQGRPGTQ